MTPQAAHPLPLALTRRETVCFGVLFFLLLAPALLNGFPLVMSDSIAYSGQGAHWMRGKTAAVLMTLPYKLAGYWALPILTSAMNAGAWILLLRVFDIRPNLFVLTGLVCLSLQPLYTSAVLVDAWFFPAIVLLVSSIRLPALFVGGLAGLLLSSHGSGLSSGNCLCRARGRLVPVAQAGDGVALRGPRGFHLQPRARRCAAA